MALSDTLNFFAQDQLANFTQQAINGTQLFSVRITAAYDRNAISDISPFNICNVEFKVTDDIQEWECRATLEGQAYGVGVGLLVQSGSDIAANESKQFYITSAQLKLGYGRYRISVYAKRENIWYGG